MVTCPAGSTRPKLYLEVYWPSADGLSVENAIGTQWRDPIGTQLRDPMNSGLKPDSAWRFKINKWTPAAELARNPVSKHQIQLSLEMSRLTRDGTAEPASRDQILRRERVFVCVCVFFPFILDIKCHTGFLIHLPSAVLALIFLARRIQLFLSLVDREVDFFVLTIQSFSTTTCWAFFT